MSNTVSALSDYKAQLRQAMRSARPDLEQAFSSMPDRTRVWLALAPGWPSTFATLGFPIGPQGLATGQSVMEQLDRWSAQNLLDAAPTGPPWDATWYALPAGATTAALESPVASSSAGPELLQSELTAIGRALSSAPLTQAPPTFRRFLMFARAAASGTNPIGAVADRLDEEVRAAIKAAEKARAPVCPEGVRWLEVAEPLGNIFGRVLLVAVERARHRLELFERQSRDDRFLRSYIPRPHLEQAFLDLIGPGSDEAWALHYIGEGGFGKTMLVRRITSFYTREKHLLTSRVDFDHLNPDYPTRAPGLLLLALSEDLKLSDDPAVADKLERLYEVIGAAHRRIEGATRKGAATSVDRLMAEAVARFADVLRVITMRSRPVFILDTCEELARIRPTGELPDAVVRTFSVLEQLHAAVPELRVVFSGRRSLASGGEGGWTDSRSPLPPRKYLCLARVEAFDRQEADAFLQGYRWETIAADGTRIETRGIDPRFRTQILTLSRIDRRSPAQVAEPSETAERYNPFDLDLYSSWLTTGGSDPQRLLAAGQHLYTRERIVGHVNEKIRPWLPILAQLGRFDEALLNKLAWDPATIVKNVVAEVTAQEWVEPERGAVWRQVENAPPSPEITWVVGVQAREQLKAYFVAEEPDRWRESRNRLRSVLPDVVRERPWHALIPEYFTVAFDVLCDTPDRAARWWADIDRKIAADAAWPWALEVLGRLTSDEGPADPDRIPNHPLEAALSATRAMVSRWQTGDGRNADVHWRSVLHALERIPDPHVAAVLRYRANACLAGGLRWTDRPLSTGSLHELEDVLSRVATLHTLEEETHAPLDIQLLSTELALLENVVETLERIRWQSAPPSGIPETLLGRAEVLGARLDSLMNADDLAAEMEMLTARTWRLCLDIPRCALWVDRALKTAEGLPAGRQRGRLLDWNPPEAPRDRVRVEAARLVRFLGPTERAEQLATIPVDAPDTLDGDRLCAIQLLMIADDRVPDDVPDTAIDRSVKVNAEGRPDSVAHRSVPPLFEVALAVKADRGQIAAAVARSQAIAQSAARSLDVRQAAERALVAISVKWRLVERGIARQTSLDESTLPIDRVASLAATAMDAGTPAQVFRWQQAYADLARPGSGTGQEITLAAVALRALDAAEAAGLNAAAIRSVTEARVAIDTPGFDVLDPELALRARTRIEPGARSGMHGAPGRLVAQIALEEGAFIIGWQPDQALKLLFAARVSFEACGDLTGATLASLGCALALARLDRISEIQPELERVRRFGEASGGSVPVLPSANLENGWESWNDRARVLSGLSKDGTLDAEALQLVAAMAADAPHPGGKPPVAGPVTAQPATRLRSSLRVLARSVQVLFGLAILYAGFRFLYSGFVWALGLVGIHASTTVNIVTFFGLFLLLGSLPAIMRAYVRVVGRVLLFVRVVDVPEGVRVSVDDLLTARIRPVSVSLLKWTPLAERLSNTTGWSVNWGADRWRQWYVDVASRSARLKERNFFGRLADVLLSSVELRIVLVIPPAVAGEPWEATIWDHDTHLAFLNQRLIFSRTSRLEDVRGPWRLATASPPSPFTSETMIVRMESKERADSRYLQQVWTGRMRNLAHVDGQLRVGGRTEQDIRPRGRVGIVHLLSSIFEDDRGLSLEGRLPSELMTEYPDARLFILQRPLRSDTSRHETDRLDASRARQFAAQLFDAGAPAVLVVPSLPPDLAAEALEPVAGAALGGHRRASEPLARAVRLAQERIAGRLAGKDDLAAFELPFDACFYVGREINLQITGVDQ